MFVIIADGKLGMLECIFTFGALLDYVICVYCHCYPKISCMTDFMHYRLCSYCDPQSSA